MKPHGPLHPSELQQTKRKLANAEREIRSLQRQLREALGMRRAAAFEICFCEDRDCGGHILAYDHSGAIISEIKLAADQTQQAIDSLKAGQNLTWFSRRTS